ncbi:hypothetical protein R5W23_003359 [Gemmata sp. JC673]|uniref:Uncharacterized protein n=1 Tax=Gemmata algarum TaxID=2975278 RepID=A0ABU5F7U2_9BACT|nr:hypothetical protein [Gemmata algarum]MDY3561929.1 hypothetical protein [Gemmata algarum]
MIPLAPEAFDLLMEVPPLAPVPLPQPFRWRCLVCRREARFGSEHLVRFACDGWPVCCGEVVVVRRDRPLGLAECE